MTRLMSLVSGTVLLMVTMLGCHASQSRSTSEDDAQATTYKVTALTDDAAIFGVERGACFAQMNGSFEVSSLTAFAESKIWETAFRRQGEAVALNVKDIDDSTGACSLPGESGFYLAEGEWKVEKIEVQPGGTPTIVGTVDGTVDGNDDRSVTTPSGTVQPGRRQILVQVATDIASTVLKNKDNTERCTLKTVRNFSFLITIDDSVPDINAYVRDKTLPVVISDEGLRQIADLSQQSCAKKRGFVFLPHFKCIKFGDGFNRPEDINSKFHVGNHCQLAK